MRLKLALLASVLLGTFSLLLVRLVDITVLRGASFREQADDNRYFTRHHPVERAIFLDRYGQALVRNQKQYFTYLVKDQLYSARQFLGREEALGLLATESAKVGYEFSRIYTYKEAMSSVLGYLSLVTAEDLTKNAQLPISGRVGRMGLEQFFDHNLQARDSVSRFEIDAMGKIRRLLSVEAPVYGQNIQTSLDPQLSEVAYQAMGEKKGAVVVMDASNGEILALVSVPSFDANVFEENFVADLYKSDKAPSIAKIASYLTDERQFFFNRSVSGAYPPGSVFKLITALAALQEGVIDASTTVDDQGSLKVGGSEFANWYFTQYGRVEGMVSVQKALARSNDIFFYKAAEWLGPDRLARYARLFGLGSPTGLQLSGELSGLVPDPAWKENTKGENWYLGNTYHFGIGQGDVLVTPVQVANFTQAIANHGKLCQSSLLPAMRQNCKDLALSESNLEIVLSGMVGACSQGGTAFPLFPHNALALANVGRSGANLMALPPNELIDAGLVACKTGTAEFGAPDERGYRKTHAWTTAIVGVDQSKHPNLPKRLVITVLVESDGNKIYSEGSADAAPVVAKVVEAVR